MFIFWPTAAVHVYEPREGDASHTAVTPISKQASPAPAPADVGVPQGKRVQITGGNLTIRGFGVIEASASNSSSGGTGSTAGTVSSGSVSIAPADDGGNAAAGGANGTAAGAGAASSGGQQAPLPARVALFDGSLSFTTLFINVVVLGNFTLQRALNWTYNGTTKLYSAQIGMAGSFEMALTPVPSAVQDGSGGDSTAGGSSSSSVLHPTVGGSLELASSRRPGPGFTGSYDWRGSLLMTPNPFAVWAAAVAAAGASGGSVQRRRGLLQQADPWASSLVVPVQGPVAVNEWGAAPVSSSTGSSGGGSGSSVLIDKDGSIQLLGEDSATAPSADSPGPAAGGNSSAGGNSTTGSAGAAAPLAQRPKALSTRNLVIIIATSTAGLLALASCGVLAAKAAARRRRRRRDKEEAARLRLRNGQPAPDFQIPDPVAELGQPGGAASSANGGRRGSQGPAPAALPSSRGSEERRHSSSLSGSLFSGSGAKIAMLFGTLGFGFHGHRGTLPGARYASTVGEDASAAQARRGGAAAGEGSSAGAARPGHARQRGSLEFRRRSSLELRWRGSLDLGGGTAAMFGNPWGDIAPSPPAAPTRAHSPLDGEILAATAGVQRRRVGGGGAHPEQADWRNTSGGASDEASHDGHAKPSGQFAFLTRMMAGRAAATAAAAAAAAAAAQPARHRAPGACRSAAGQGIAGVAAPFNPLFDPTPDFLAGLGSGAWEPEEEILQLSDNGGIDRPPSIGSLPARGPPSVPRPRS